MDTDLHNLICCPDWEVYINRLAGAIAKEQLPLRLLEAQAMLYELLVHLIPPSVIIVQLANDLLTQVDEALRPEIIYWAACRAPDTPSPNTV
ncbi:hypothetical protein PSTG_09187 [Puccinia striiformis f. sp. tritici PST-78]|uniref:Uncharacterized protein n=1 Tax=Puccinia striiformis f. sp. tritici PST-78 TaxID=1165861 RepID=A0A0L0VEV6_9BASI|nr:hypothetical protein PSTG_09187 [Puccinia striiformis f. sp. tritici PST-78]